jgi:hypothetical protein
MKKIYIVIMLLFISVSYAQETFVRNYNFFIVTKNNISEEPTKGNLTVVFNPKNKKEVKFYYSDNSTKTFYQTSPVELGKTKSGFEFQSINVINAEDGYNCTIQLFDENKTLRIIFADGYNIEFYE